jgi:hypothetical protein
LETQQEEIAMPQPPQSKAPGGSAQRPRRPVRPLDTEDVVHTPGGVRPRDLVQILQDGEHISLKDGHVRIIETATGKVVKDLGPVATAGEESPPEIQKTQAITSDVGWIENAQWRNDGSDPIIYFTTTWIVPPVPASSDGQTVYLFNGMQPDNAAHILQPVLQWGSSAAGGGNYWSIANWYADGQGGQSVVKSPNQVSPGTVLQGVITCTGQSASGYNYTCQFIGYPGIDITVTDAPELTWAYQTLECYGTYAGVVNGVPTWNPLAQCSDYPGTVVTAMYDIEIKTGTPGGAGTDATIDWAPVTNFTDCGQSCIIVSNASPGGEVDLYYRPPILWQSNLTVGQTFATNDSENAWAYFENVGWRRILPGSTDGVTNMLSLFALAEAKNLQVTVYADNSNVYQAYLL